MPVHKPKSCRERVNLLICQRITRAFPQIGRFFVKIAVNMLEWLNNQVPIPHCGNALGSANKNKVVSRFCLARTRKIYPPSGYIFFYQSPPAKRTRSPTLWAPGPAACGHHHQPANTMVME